jgi:hypothetical protein
MLPIDDSKPDRNHPTFRSALITASYTVAPLSFLFKFLGQDRDTNFLGFLCLIRAIAVVRRRCRNIVTPGHVHNEDSILAHFPSPGHVFLGNPAHHAAIEQHPSPGDQHDKIVHTS